MRFIGVLWMVNLMTNILSHCYLSGTNSSIFVNCIIHLRKFGNTGHQDGGFHHICHGHSVGFQNGKEIFQKLAGLADDVATRKFSGSGIDGKLSGDVHSVSGSNALGVRSDGSGGEMVLLDIQKTLLQFRT